MTLADAGPVDLDPGERERALRLSSVRARSEFIARRSRLRNELARRTGIHPEQISYWREPCPRCGGPHGRPRAHGHDGWFSTSSAPGVVALAFADAPVGIDVEALVPHERARQVTPLLHPRERHVVAEAFAVGDDAGRRAFTRIWTRKEALLKGTGEGLGAPLDRDDVSAPNARPVRGWHIGDLAPEALAGEGTELHGAWALARRESRTRRA